MQNSGHTAQLLIAMWSSLLRNRRLFHQLPVIAQRGLIAGVALICSSLLLFFLTLLFSEPATKSFWKSLWSPNRQPVLRAVTLDRPVTVVTAYYEIPSKQSKKQYLDWMGNFLPIIPCYLYIYTDERHVNILRKLRGPYVNRTNFIVKPFKELRMSQRMDMWREQKMLDHEPYHTPELYIVWNEKINFLKDTIEDNAFDSDYFIWTDCGSFRNLEQAKQLTTYPDTSTTATLLGMRKVFFLQMQGFAKDDYVLDSTGLAVHDFQHDVRLGGTVIGGHMFALLEYEKRFYETLERMREKGFFVGKDQNIMSSVAVMYPDLVHLVSPQSYLGDGDPWFYAHYYFSERVLPEQTTAVTVTSDN